MQIESSGVFFMNIPSLASGTVVTQPQFQDGCQGESASRAPARFDRRNISLSAIDRFLQDMDGKAVKSLAKRICSRAKTKQDANPCNLSNLKNDFAEHGLPVDSGNKSSKKKKVTMLTGLMLRLQTEAKSADGVRPLGRGVCALMKKTESSIAKGFQQLLDEVNDHHTQLDEVNGHLTQEWQAKTAKTKEASHAKGKGVSDISEGNNRPERSGFPPGESIPDRCPEGSEQAGVSPCCAADQDNIRRPRVQNTNKKEVAINATDKYGRTALHRAAYRGNIERLKQLIATEGVNINATDKDGMTPMHWAAEQGNAKCLQELLTTVGVDVHAIDNLARTPWNIALASVLDKSKIECWELMKLVNNGMKPMHWAAFQGNTQYLKQLVTDHGVNINATDEDSKTALHWAAFQGNIACVLVLIDVEGLNINAVDVYGNTPLHWASQYGHSECVESLVVAGAKVNAANDTKGMTPLHLAANYGHSKCVEFLVTRGAYVEAVTDDDSTPLHQAACNFQHKCMEKLVTLGANINATDKNGRTALHMVAGLSCNCVDILLDLGANINVADKSGRTPLHKAAEKGNSKCIEQLISAGGVNINAIDNEGRTPLHCAFIKGNSRSVKRLIAADGVNINATDVDGKTPLDFAVSQGNTVQGKTGVVR